MSRPLRIQYPGTYDHVTNQGGKSLEKGWRDLRVTLSTNKHRLTSLFSGVGVPIGTGFIFEEDHFTEAFSLSSTVMIRRFPIILTTFCSVFIVGFDNFMFSSFW